jgi:hypothetical protein
MADTETPAPKGRGPAKNAPAAKRVPAARKAPARTRPPADAAAGLRAELKAVASARPAGWDHQDWMSFLDHLTEKGHDTSDHDGIGRALEHERLAVVLGQVPGLGPKRLESLVCRYETLWSIRQADADDLARVQGMNRPLAEKVRQALQR